MKTISLLSTTGKKPRFERLDYRIDVVFSSIFTDKTIYVWYHNFISAN